LEKEKKLKKEEKTGMIRSISKQSKKSVESVLKKKRKATVGKQKWSKKIIIAKR